MEAGRQGKACRQTGQGLQAAGEARHPGRHTFLGRYRREGRNTGWAVHVGRSKVVGNMAGQGREEDVEYR